MRFTVPAVIHSVHSRLLGNLSGFECRNVDFDFWLLTVLHCVPLSVVAAPLALSFLSLGNSFWTSAQANRLASTSVLPIYR
jgi:hypothetical protein